MGLDPQRQRTTAYSAAQWGQVDVEVVNTGKTPALDAGIALAGIGETEKSIIMKPAAENFRKAIAPGASTPDFYYIGLPPNTASRIYIRFIIEYRDIFQTPRDAPHTTEFCGYYPATRPPFFFNCPHGGNMK